MVDLLCFLVILTLQYQNISYSIEAIGKREKAQ